MPFSYFGVRVDDHRRGRPDDTVRQQPASGERFIRASNRALVDILPIQIPTGNRRRDADSSARRSAG